MKKARWLLAGLALAVVMSLGAACDTGSTDTREKTNEGAIDTSGLLSLMSSPEVKALASSFAPALGQLGSYHQSGIWVTGVGEVSLVPDMALLSLGVETRAKTVAQARTEAAVAMTGIMDALKARGVADTDIKTQYFNIYPEYTYEEVYESGLRYGRQVLVGYQVTNNITVKVRDMDALGVTIDHVVDAGGDATRIQNIQLTVEDPYAAQTQARELAVQDALAKAEQFATLTGVELGDLVFITESGSAVPRTLDIASKDMGFAGAESVPTPISAGEMQVQAYVQAVFAIGSN